MILKERLTQIIPEWQERVTRLLRNHRDMKIDEVTIGQVYGGMRGVKGLVSEISSVHPIEGIRLRGYAIPQLLELLPKPPGAEIPYAGGLYYLFLTGDIPSTEEATEVEDAWRARSEIPDHVIKVLQEMPANAAPMTLFSQAILSLQSESVFTARFETGMRKHEYWVPMLEDSLNLTAKLPSIAALIYKYRSLILLAV